MEENQHPPTGPDTPNEATRSTPFNQLERGGLDFSPVPLRYRSDGLTPQKQREFVEALADCGVARQAAAVVGVSEQAINRTRRRVDARSFDLACDAAARFGARRIRSLAFERAIEGTTKRHYYHGELKSEEVVYDNRLLIYLLGKTEHLVEPEVESVTTTQEWEALLEAVEQGLPPPHEAELFEPETDEPHGERDPAEAMLNGCEVWEELEGEWWTIFPPPAGFDGVEEGEPGDPDYKRMLSEAELSVQQEEEEFERSDRIAEQMALRDYYFGFEGGGREGTSFSFQEAETYETSAASGEDSD
jgi:hypothetical protein